VIELAPEVLKAVVAEAGLAPSVHNIQPARWRHRRGVIELYGDRTRTVPVADPSGRDWRLSLGASLEGLSRALQRRGLAIAIEYLPCDSAPAPDGPLQRAAIATLQPSSEPAPDVAPEHSRVSWRGAFKPSDPAMHDALDRLAAWRSDLVLVRDEAFIAHAARLGDTASLHFLRDEAHRRELLAWMRLSTSDPRFARDGLNAHAMGLGTVEALGAGLVLGPLFPALDRLGLAPRLLAESARTRSASAIALFHRPVGEDAILSGRAFYHAWLDMETCGIGAVPMSVLADWPVARNALHRLHGLAPDRAIVNVFRIGRPQGTPSRDRARLPVDELIV